METPYGVHSAEIPSLLTICLTQFVIFPNMVIAFKDCV